VQVINQENGGLSVARNNGLHMAQGEYVWFVDSDDWINEGCLRRITRKLKNELDILQLQFRWAYDDEEKSFDELVASMDQGILVTDVSGLHAGLNPISGAFNVQASGFEIKDGKIDRPVTLFVVSSNFYELLNNIEEIASDLEENFIDVAAPSVKIKSVMISGK
jgi:glycosyltransferase involved in cell wall biosynthesis